MSRAYDEDGWETPDFKKVEIQTKTIETKSRGFGPNLEAIVGICATCGRYQYVLNDTHQLVHSYCCVHERYIGRHKVKECSAYHAKNQLSLNTMYEMATLIDVVEDKAKIGGFTGKTNKFRVSIKPPQSKEED